MKFLLVPGTGTSKAADLMSLEESSGSALGIAGAAQAAVIAVLLPTGRIVSFE